MSRPDKALQDALTYACERGRYEGGWPLIHPRLLCIKTPAPVEPTGLHLNSDGLAGLERDAIRIALHDCHGNATLAARRLKIKRSTIYDKIKRLGVFAPLVLLLAGCAPRITRMNAGGSSTFQEAHGVTRPTLPALAVLQPTTTEASGQAVSAPRGETVLFAWDRSASPEAVGYRLWYGHNSAVYTNSVDVGHVTGAALTNLLLPVFVAATAYDAAGLQSPFSNEILVQGWDTVVRINALTNTVLNTNWVFSHTIFTATNPPAGFWKLEAVSTRQPR